jgi:hypothetical protein
MDALTPLDARNSLLLDRVRSNEGGSTTFSMADNVHESKMPLTRGQSPDRYHHDPANPYAGNTYGGGHQQPLLPNPVMPYGGDRSQENLLGSAAPMSREPIVPNVGYRAGGGGYRNYRGV